MDPHFKQDLQEVPVDQLLAANVDEELEADDTVEEKSSMTPPQVDESKDNVFEVSKAADGTGSPEQRKRGRPRKHPKVEDTGPKRGRGRPRKEETVAAATGITGAYSDIEKMRSKLT